MGLFGKKNHRKETIELPDSHICIENKDEGSVFTRDDRRRHTTTSRSKRFRRNDPTRQSLDNHEAIVLSQKHFVEDNRKLRREKEFLAKRVNLMEQDKLPSSQGTEVITDANTHFTISSGDRGITYLKEPKTAEDAGDVCGAVPVQNMIIDETMVVALQQQLEKITLENQQITMEKQQADAMKEKYRNQLLNERQQKNKDDKTNAELAQNIIAIVEQGKESKVICNEIKKTVESHTGRLQKIQGAIENQKELICRLPTALQDNCGETYDALPQDVKDVMNYMQEFIGPNWTDLVLRLGLPPDLIKSLRQPLMGQSERYWTIMCSWYNLGNASLVNLFTVCHQMGINLLSDKPMSKDDRSVLDACYSFLIEDGDAVLIVPYMRKHVSFPMSLDGYLDTENRLVGMQRLLDVLPVFGSKALPAFVQGLEDSGHHHLAVAINAKREAFRRTDNTGSTLECVPLPYIDVDTMRKPRPEVDPVNDSPISPHLLKELDSKVQHIEAMTISIAMQLSRQEELRSQNV